MTFYIAPSFDTHYSCPSGHNGPNGASHVDRRTWTCSECHCSLDIDMTDSSGLTLTVERHPANTIRPNDHIVWDKGNSHLGSGKVFESEAASGKRQATHWTLAVKGFGKQTVPANQYINRI